LIPTTNRFNNEGVLTCAAAAKIAGVSTSMMRDAMRKHQIGLTEPAWTPTGYEFRTNHEFLQKWMAERKPKEGFCDVVTAAGIIGCTRSSVVSLIKSGKFPSAYRSKVTKNYPWFLSIAEVEQFKVGKEVKKQGTKCAQ
jgi:hypothetical protein